LLDQLDIVVYVLYVGLIKGWMVNKVFVPLNAFHAFDDVLMVAFNKDKMSLGKLKREFKNRLIGKWGLDYCVGWEVIWVVLGFIYVWTV